MMCHHLTALIVGLSGCGGRTLEPDAPPAIETPPQWRFLGAITLETLYPATDTGFRAHVPESPNEIRGHAARG